MHFNTKNLIGQRFFKLLVLKDSGQRKDRHILCLCKCDCGKEALRPGKELKSRGRSSCGCFLATFIGDATRTHGKSNSASYSSWTKMIDRCFNKKAPGYKYYGGRGISVCANWLKFEFFYKDMGDPSSVDKNTIDRIDNYKGYEKDNCRWASMKDQANNKREKQV